MNNYATYTWVLMNIYFVVVGINAHFDNGISLNCAIGDDATCVDNALVTRQTRFASLVVTKALFDKGFTVGARGTLPCEIRDGKARTDGTFFQKLVPTGSPKMDRLGDTILGDWDITSVE
jgi:hypothetical protein